MLPLALAVASLAAAPATSAPLPPASVVERLVGDAVRKTARALAVRRRVRLTRPIAVKVLDRPHLSAELTKLGEGAAGPPAEARARAALLALLGLGAVTSAADAPDEDDAVSPAGDVTGLYDAATGRVLVASFSDLGAGRFTIARDAAEAVLDQRFGLARFLAPPPSRAVPALSFDAVLAREAIVEGDATVQALELLDPGGELPPPRALAAAAAEAEQTIRSESAGEAPLALARRLFVALDGLTFVADVRARAPWSAVDALWARPPASSEQVLHPEKYERREAPDPVGARLPAALPGGFRAVHAETLGELAVRVFLSGAAGEDRASRAAAGWGGDRALLLARDGAGAVAGHAREGGAGAGSLSPPAIFAAWTTTWDRDPDAEDFAEQAARAVAALAGAPPERMIVRKGRAELRDVAGRLCVVARRGRAVVLLIAAPPEARAIVDALLTSATRRRS